MNIQCDRFTLAGALHGKMRRPLPDVHTLRTKMMQTALRAGRGHGRRLAPTTPEAERAAAAARTVGTHPGGSLPYYHFIEPDAAFRSALEDQARRAAIDGSHRVIPPVTPFVRIATPPPPAAPSPHSAVGPLRGGGAPSPHMAQDDIVGWAAVALAGFVAAVTPFQNA